jgi:hypothetical protein
VSHPTLDDLIAGSDTATLDTARLAPLPRGTGTRRTLDDLIAADTVQPDTSALHPRSPGDPGGNITLGPPVAPRPAPARGRGIVGKLGEALGGTIGDLLAGRGGEYVGPERIGGQGLYDPATEEHRRPAYIPDRRTAEERAAAAARA